MTEHLSSVDDIKPAEEGGPTARRGFAYQDYIAASYLIEMLEAQSILKVHCETHDDVLVIRSEDGSSQGIAEFIQVKAHELDQLWSVAKLCEANKDGPSILERSLSHDNHKEISRFKIVTLRPVAKILKPLTFPYGSPGRESDGDWFNALRADIEKRLPGLKSPKGNGISYWLENCVWDEGGSKDAIRNRNLFSMMRHAANNGTPCRSN